MDKTEARRGDAKCGRIRGLLVRFAVLTVVQSIRWRWDRPIFLFSLIDFQFHRLFTNSDVSYPYKIKEQEDEISPAMDRLGIALQCLGAGPPGLYR